MVNIFQKAPVLHRFVQLLLNKEVEDKTIHQAKRIVADCIGVAYSGVQTKAFHLALPAKYDLFGKGDLPIWGIDETCDLPGSVFYNALSISLTDFDEGHRKAVGHPASCVVPVAMMLGKRLNKSYHDILKAIIIGYEAGTRFSFSRKSENISSYSTGRWGAIAAASTAAVLLHLNTEQFMYALSLAYVTSPVMQGGSTDVSTGSMLKEGAAWAAQMGLQSAILAKKNFTGPYLFIDAYDEIDFNKLTEGEHNEWLINSNYFKPFACCRWLHTAIQLVINLQTENQLFIEAIEKIEVDLFGRTLDLIESKYPENVIQAQFHLPFVLACALVYGKVTPAEITETNIGNPELHAIIDKITLIPDENMNKVFPSELRSKVTIVTKEKTVSKEANTAPWEADNQPTDDELFIKFKLQTGDKANKLWQTIFETIRDD